VQSIHAAVCEVVADPAIEWQRRLGAHVDQHEVEPRARAQGAQALGARFEHELRVLRGRVGAAEVCAARAGHEPHPRAHRRARRDPERQAVRRAASQDRSREQQRQGIGGMFVDHRALGGTNGVRPSRLPR
jgi:hypothetical protein